MGAPPLAPPATPVISEPGHGFATTDDIVHVAGQAPGAERVEVRGHGADVDIPVTAADGSFAADVDLPDIREYTLRIRAVNAAGESEWVYVVVTRELVPGFPAPAPGPRRRAPAPAGGDEDEEGRNWVKTILVGGAIVLGILLAVFLIFLIIRFASSPSSVPASANAGNTQSVPSAPSNLTATAGTNQITLNWTPGSGNATQYVVKRGGETIATPSGTTFTDNNVTPGTSYQYTVQAQGPGGTVSDPSNTATVTAQGSSSSSAAASSSPAATSSASAATASAPAGGTGPITINQPQNVGMVAQITGGGALPTGDVIRLFVFAPGEGMYHPQDVAQATSSGWSAQAYFGSTDPGDVGARYTLFAVQLTAAQNAAVDDFHNRDLNAGYNGQQWQDNFAGHIVARTTVVRSH